MKLNKGFTLIELLISLAIVILIGSVSAGVLASVLRTSKKAANIEKVRRNGNYALTQMAREIEYAKAFEGLSSDDIAYDLTCVSSDYDYIKITNWDDISLTYECISPVGPSTDAIFRLNSNDIFDTTSIKVTECEITCIQDKATDAPTIGIHFTLDTAEQLSLTNLVENSAPEIDFRTSIKIKNYNY